MIDQDKINRKIVWILTEMVIVYDTAESNKNILEKDLVELSELISQEAEE